VRARGVTGLLLAALAACVLAAGFAAASFTDSTQNPQTVSAVADFLPPSVGASAIGKAEGGTAGFVRPNGGYRVYANLTDSGNPSSKTSSVKADVSALTSGQTAVALVAGSYSFDGATYNYRSAQLKAGSGVSAGSKSYALSLLDGAGNAGVESFPVTVNGHFAGSSFATANGPGNDSGEPEEGDTVTFTYTDVPEPESIKASWDGEAISVKVSIADSSGNETLSVGGVSLGSVSLKGDYVASGKTVSFSGSSMTLSGSTVTIALGEPSSTSSLNDDNSSRAPVWSPSAAADDRAGNACSAASVTGVSARQF
jgi:hypothetical protein